MEQDIRETGPVGLRGLNRQQSIKDMSLADQWKLINSIPKTSYSSAPEESVGLQAMASGYGDSRYDEGITSTSQFEDIGDIRYNNQPWYDAWANGIGKMAGTAGTTFISSLVGLPYGLIAAGVEGRASAIWDNDVTRVLSAADEWLENNMTNYKSQAQQNAEWYDPENLFSMNWYADNVIKNMGFTLGAAASMAVGSGTLGLLSRSLGFVNNINKGAQMANNVAGALFSATGEAMIEAKQGVEERNKLELQKLNDALAPEAKALALEEQQINEEYAANKGQRLTVGYDGKYVDPAYERYKQRMEDLGMRKGLLNQKYEEGKKQIEESGLEMGNKIMGANQVLLTAGNLLQFNKLLTRSFGAARHAANVSSKATAPFLVGAQRAGKTLAEGYKVTGKVPGTIYALSKGIVTEGSEEMNQQWIQSAAGASSNEVDVNDYWRARLDPEAYRETTKGLYTLGHVLGQGFKESWGDIDQWEQFVVGAMTGALGTWSPTKLFNQDKTKKIFDPRRYGSWEGGAINELIDFYKGTKENLGYNQYVENVNALNAILAQGDFASRVESMVGHAYTEDKKEVAAEERDKKVWKDEDDKQMIHDIQAFLRAGKLDDLRTIYDEVGSSLSDEQIDEILKRTTRHVTPEEDKQHYTEAIDQQIAEEQRKIEGYKKDLDFYNGATGANYDYSAEQIVKTRGDIAKSLEKINELNAQKEAYVGNDYYEGPYVDADGNKMMTEDQIKEIIKHNQEELNRKLESYLQSVEYVDKRTGGKLTKDQEDNLAYLHNLGKESIVRMQKIMAGVRKSLPSKFLLKTNKTPEQLAKENASSDLAFSRDENTKEGYVEVDTSLMNDAAFADFFQREIMRGGNINPEFAETADEKAAREEEEKSLPEAEQKKKARERATKKWREAVEKQQQDSKEQWETNWDMLVDNFMNNYKKEESATLEETIDAFNEVGQDILDASNLYNQAGEFNKTLAEYMANPTLVDKDKEKAEKAAEKAESEKQAKNKFVGKNAKEMNQQVADGTLSIDDLDNFADADLSDVTDEDVRAAQEEAKKSKEIRQKQASIKNHIQENLGDAPTPEEVKAAEIAMQMVDNAAYEAENPSDISIDVPALNQVPIDAVDPNANIEDVEALSMDIQEMLSDAFNSWQEDIDAQDDIPEEVPNIDDEEVPVTGDDETTKLEPEVVAPDTGGTQKKSKRIIVPKNPLTTEAIENIKKATEKLYEKPNENGTWRSTTTRYRYHSSTQPYHETIADRNSKEYKRSKAIYDYLQNEGAFDKLDNASEDRIKAKDTIHFMVRYLPEVFEKNLEELSEEEKPYALVVLMLNDNGEVLGDLPLAQLEPSYKRGNMTQEVRDLLTFQEKVFNAFTEYHAQQGGNEAVVDSKLTKEGIGNLKLTFGKGKKTDLVSSVKQVMRGVVPYVKDEKNTLNDVAGDSSFDLGARVSATNVGLESGDKKQHREIAIPSVGNLGQPYVMLPTPSGEKIAVPFYMPFFNPSEHKDTELYRHLSNAIAGLLVADPRDLKVIERNKDVVKGLLQVEEQEGKKIVEVVGGNVRMHLQSLTDSDKKIEVSIPYNGNPAETAVALVDSLNNIPINVSLVFTNKNIETVTPEGWKRTSVYNQVIGEIANVNLPKGTTHTVNGWFTIEIPTEEGLRPSKAVQPKGDEKTNTPTEKPAEKKAEPVKIEMTQKTLEQIEDEMQKAKVINRQTKEAWGAIPDELKMKLVNDGLPLQFAYNGKNVTMGLNNVNGLIKTLIDANMAAKSGKLNVTAGVKPMEKNGATVDRENEREAKRWLAKNLPSLNSEERTQFVDRLARMGNDAHKYWGSYRSGVIQIQRNAPMGTVYHEAFHYVMDMVLSPEERQAFLDIAKKHYGVDLTNWEAEERLAEDFRRYSLDENATGIVGTLKKWFRKLRDKIVRYNRISDTSINQLFWKINNGKLAQKSMQAENFEENQQRVLGEIRNVQREKYSWDNLDGDTKRNLESSGLSKAAYEQLSLEIQEQYVKCRG